MREQRFSKELRQQIIEDFARDHGGTFDAAGFLGVVQQVGKKHSAYEWFEWSNQKAAREHRLWQAREFAIGLKIRFDVETVERGKVRIVSTTAPMVISPLDSRKDGGGYFVTDPKNPDHMAEHCRQAALALKLFLVRYEGAVVYAGGNIAMLQEAFGLLQIASSVSQPEAAE